MGYADDTGTYALFNYPTGVVSDSAGNLYVADQGNYRIRKITPSGVVTTIAGNSNPVTVNGIGTAASFSFPTGLAIDTSGNLYVADSDCIRKITLSYTTSKTYPPKITAGWTTVVLAGVVTSGIPSRGYIDSTTGTAAKFNRPQGIVVNPSNGDVYVADSGNNRIRKITSTGSVTTVAGGAAGFADGTGTAARFSYPSDITIDSSGNLYVADQGNNRIRKITQAGVVTTLAGNANYGFQNGTGSSATFDTPTSISIDPSGNLYVTEPMYNLSVRKITPAGVVTTVATGFVDPVGITIDKTTGYVYVTEKSSFYIAKLVISCTAGNYFDKTSLTCSSCTAGTYSAAGASSCSSCAAGTYSAAGASSCSSCTAGTYSAAGASSCSSCAAGTYSAASAVSCTLCAAGTYSSGGSSSCTSCAAGTYSSGGASSCSSCTAGTYSSGGSSACSPCTAGTYSTAVNATSSAVCTLCAAGTYSSAGSSACSPCTAGTYSSGGASVCTSCAAGTYSTAVNATNSSVCNLCTAGTYSSAGSSACSPCAAGTYSSATGASTCSPCDGGTYSVVGATACTDSCPLFSIVLGSACLTFCPPGKYKSGTSCLTCPAGTSYVGSGANSVTDCTSCGSGTYSGIGFPVCSKCPAGTSFSGTRGTNDAVCVSCAAGTYSNTPGTTNCSSCPAGTSSGTGYTFCYRATGGIIDDRDPYIIHTFTASGNFIPIQTGLVIHDLIYMTATEIYSSVDTNFTLTQTTYSVTIASGTTPTIAGKSLYLNSSKTRVTEYGTFSVGTPQFIIVYLKNPCPGSTFWNPLKKQCVSSCTTPYTTSQNGVCVKCSSDLALTTPFVCEPGFTFTGTTCIGTENKCPDDSWTLSGTTCTKTEMSCPSGSEMTQKNYCMSSTTGISQLPLSVTSTQAAVSTTVTKAASGSVCVASCPLNTYKSDGVCVQCPGGQISVSGSTSVTACMCPANTYGTNGSGVCTSCGPNMTSSVGTQTRGGCVLSCPVGSYASYGMCVPCPYGTSQAGSTSVYACMCAPGTFLSNGSCVGQCPANMYGDARNAVCISCPSPHVSNMGSVSVTDCMCPDGTGGTNGSGICTSCTGGQISAVTDVTCPDDTWTLTGYLCSKVSGYECPNSTDWKVTDTCYSTNFTYPSAGCTLKSYTCPSGWTLNGSVCFQMGQPMSNARVTVSCPSSTGYTCPSGYTLYGTTCRSNTPLYYSCQNGGSEVSTYNNSGSTSLTSPWILSGTGSNSVCKRYRCGSDTPSGTYLMFTGSTCMKYNTTYTCPDSSYRQEAYAGSFLTSLAGIPGCNKWQNVTDDYDVVAYVDQFYQFFKAVGRVKNYCPWWFYNGPSSANFKTSPNPTRPVISGTNYPGTALASPYEYRYTVGPDNKCKLCDTGYTNPTLPNPPGYYTSGPCTNQCYRHRNPQSQIVVNGVLKLVDCVDPALSTNLPLDYDSYRAILTSTLRATPYSVVESNVAVRDQIAATPVFDEIPASHTMVDIVLTENTPLTRTPAYSTNTTLTGSIYKTYNQRQCTCKVDEFWEYTTKRCYSQCPAGTYAFSAQRTCEPCPANKTSPVGSTSVNQCVCSYAFPYWSGQMCMQQLNPTAAVTVSGSGIKTSYVDKYVIHEFTQTASFIVNSPIIANILLVGGGAGGTTDGKPGLGGYPVYMNNSSLVTGSYDITVGLGGAPNTDGQGSSISGPGLYTYAWEGSPYTDLTSSTKFTFTNLQAAIMYCPTVINEWSVLDIDYPDSEIIDGYWFGTLSNAINTYIPGSPGSMGFWVNSTSTDKNDPNVYYIYILKPTANLNNYVKPTAKTRGGRVWLKPNTPRPQGL